MTLRLRLTLWLTLLLAAVLILYAVLFQAILERALLVQAENTLRSVADQTVAAFEAAVDPSAARLPRRVILSSQVYGQATSISGRVLDRTDNLMDRSIPLPPYALEANQQGTAELYIWAEGPDGDEVRVYSAPVRAPNGQVVATVQVGQPMGMFESVLRLVRIGLLLGSIAALLLAAVGGYLLSSTALRPIHDIAETADRIARTEDLDQRLEVTERDDEVGQLAKTFNGMMARLQQLFQTQQRLVADVSHELRTPLATVQGNLDLLRRGAARDPEMLQEGLSTIQAEVGRMSRLVSDLLLLAEADAGVRPSLKPVELDTLLLEVYREALLMAGGRVQVRLGHEDQVQVAGDGDRLKQLLLNLVSNAIKYTPEGGTITLSLHCQPNHWVRITVADTGIGIAPEDLSHIFDRFWRVDQARNRQAGGTGLGLSIARWIAEAHGGTLTVESEVGKGTVFEVKLPMLQA